MNTEVPASGVPSAAPLPLFAAGFCRLALILFWMAGTVKAADAPLLTRVSDVKSIDNDRATNGFPVRLEGVVTLFEPPLFTIQDATGGLYVDPSSLKTNLIVGQQVRIEGQTARGGFAPIVTPTTATVLGQGTLPKPGIVPWDHLLTGSEDNRWVEVRGIVKTIAAVPGAVVLDLDGMEGRFPVRCRISETQAFPSHLVDADVKIHGVYQVIYNEAGQLNGFRLQVPGLEQIVLEHPSPGDPFSLPPRSIGSLLRFDPRGNSGHRVHIRGEVLFHEPGDALYLRDGTSPLRAETATRDPLNPGDLVSVIGFPNPGSFLPTLDNAEYRKLGSGPPPEPEELTSPDQVAARHHLGLVVTKATLLGIAHDKGQQTLTLQFGPRIFDAFHHGSPGRLQDLKPGSLLTVTGICQVSFDQDRNPESFYFLIRTPDDVVVLTRPSWWTLRKLMAVVAILAASIVVVTLWVASLRTQVQSQTHELREQLQRETELEQRYRALAESSPVGIWQTDIDGHAVYANPALCRLLGLRGVSDLGDILGSATRAETLRDKTPLTAGEDPLAMASREAEVTGRDGRKRHLIITSAALTRNDGSPHGMIHSCMDVSDQKRLALEMTAARDAAEAANRAKSEFLATMSHEIRTPMNGILGMTELLQQSRLDGRQRELADTIGRSGQALLTIINDILDFSKIEAGRMTLLEEDFELRPLVEGVVSLLAQSGHGKSVSLLTDWGQGLPARLRGDPGRLRQVLLNLLGNGLKFTQQGSVTVRVRSEPPGSLRFEIIDTGIGIPSDKAALLFQPFQQVDSSHARRHDGTGLGLAISRRLVELMGGSMGLHSSPGSGSTFWFLLPIRSPIDPAPPLGLRVLVVRDHEITRRISTISLEKLGCVVETAGSGAEALARCRAGGMDAMLFDARLADMEGTALAASVRELNATPSARIRLIALVDDASEHVRSRLTAAGIDVVLVDPPPLARLRDALTPGAA